MSTPTAKRRRIDIASNTLSRPFRSPFKTPLAITATDKAVPKLKQHNFSTNADCRDYATESHIAGLAKTQRKLEKQHRDLREDLEVAEQARIIEEESDKKDPGGEIDKELQGLTEKWRRASRQAAEELFTEVRDRVNRMGGPKAWKEMQERQEELRNGWDIDPPQADEDDEDQQHTEKRDLHAECVIDPETANEKEAREGSGTPADEDTTDEFTMAMMLRTLNVSLSVIGYNEEEQHWAD